MDLTYVADAKASKIDLPKAEDAFVSLYDEDFPGIIIWPATDRDRPRLEV